MVKVNFILIILLIFIIFIVLCSSKNEKYSLGVNYADPRLIPEYPTYDHLAHSNIWTRYDLESDKDIYSPYIPCWNCGGDTYWSGQEKGFFGNL